ncbi:MAG: HTTM domain-containing protein [Planctomycetota bacterium]
MIDRLRQILTEYFTRAIAGWDQFWFTPQWPHLLAILRIGCGLMLLYSHLIWAADLSGFMGPDAWIGPELSGRLHDGTFGYNDAGFSYLWWVESSSLLWLHHTLVILVTLAMTVGFATRITVPLAWFFQIMIIHRMTGMLFGLDQIVTYMTMYLALAPCGSIFSVDAWLRGRLAERRGDSGAIAWLLPGTQPSVAAGVATRLLQIHLCVIYLFGGLAKARGETWWDGTAVYYALVSYEYQSFDLTWIVNWPRLFSFLSLLTLFWEIFYVALVWPRVTRPIVLGMAMMVHGGIALFLGMMTFGSMMMLANLIFVPPPLIARLLGSGDAVVGSTPESRESDLETKIADYERRKARLRSKEALYRERVDRLKRREQKIKDLVDRKKKLDNESDDQLGNESDLDLG